MKKVKVDIYSFKKEAVISPPYQSSATTIIKSFKLKVIEFDFTGFIFTPKWFSESALCAVMRYPMAVSFN